MRALLILPLALTGCFEAKYTYKDLKTGEVKKVADSQVDAETIASGEGRVRTNVWFDVYVIEGHRYLRGYNTSFTHMESCPCKSKEAKP